MVSHSSKLNAQRKERKKKTKKILTGAVRSLRDLETLYRSHGQVDAAGSAGRGPTVIRRLRTGEKRAGRHWAARQYAINQDKTATWTDGQRANRSHGERKLSLKAS